jgi:hypothetical protein
MDKSRNFLLRHADKGTWKIDEDELNRKFSPGDSTIIQTALSGETESPLKIEGLARSLKLAKTLYNLLPDKAVLLVMDSGKPRAVLTRELATLKLDSLAKEGQKTIHMAELDTGSLISELRDADASTWGPYDAMMTREKISEEEALARWMTDMQKLDNETPEHPHESSNRYREIIKDIRTNITSEETPIYFLGVGHSGALAQARMEDEKIETAQISDVPEFCELFGFDDKGKLIETKKIELESN